MARRQLSYRNEGSTTLGSARTRIAGQGLVSALVAVVAFLCYHATLLPGLDFGDSASFQTGVSSLTLTPRQAYPLYYGLGHLFVLFHPGEPARALNLASAVYGALAVGVATWLGARVAQSLFAGAAAGLFLASSYTFWSQAVTAEVYTLHLLVVGASMLALLAWADEPTTGRLACFYAIYALGFGNHLSMVLLLPGFAIFLLMHRRGPADPLKARMIAMALVIALLGALQYAWNFRGLWADLEPPGSLAEAFGKFWFDVTKADWRETLVMNVSETGLYTRPAMYWFDLRQQFGLPGILLAIGGIGYVAFRWPGRGVLLLLLYAANLAFAWTYNVGDAYIFFLPSHYIVALCAGAGVAALVGGLMHLPRRGAAAAAGVVLLLYPAWRGYDTFPAVDRSQDNRAVRLLHAFTRENRPTVFGVDSNWQVQNAFEYFMREHRPGVPWFATEELTWLAWPGGRDRFAIFVAENAIAARDVVLTGRAYDKVHPPHPSQWQHDSPPDELRFSDQLKGLRTGVPYVFAILRPDREFPLNTISVGRGWKTLTTATAEPSLRQYNVIAGRVGERPELVETSDRPFRVRVRIEPFDLDIRMESWLPTDTIRRAGFGHVIVNGRHELTLERGISFKALGPDNLTLYDSGIFAPIPTVRLSPQP